MLAADLHLAVLAALDYGRVIGIDQPGFGVQLLDEVIVRVRDVVVDPDVGDEGVNSHFW